MPKVNHIFPVFRVSDLDAALDFNTNELGFTLNWTWGEPIVRAGVSLDSVEIQLDCAAAGAPRGPSVVYCHIQNVTQYYQELKGRGVRFSLELGQRPWGMVDFRVKDPDGNQLGFGEQLN